MKIVLRKQHGLHMPGSVHEVAEVVPHGGYTDSEKQYVLRDQTHVASDYAVEVADDLDVVDAWAVYCRTFRRDPKDLIGYQYPGFENEPMTAEMAEKVASELGSSLPK